MGHTRRFALNPVLTKVYHVKQPPTSSSHTCDQDNCVNNVDFKGRMANIEEANNWKSLQKEDKMVQDGSQDEEFFDAMDKFQVDHPTRP